MKKVSLFFAAALGFTVAAHAQLSIIPKAGVSLASVGFKEPDEDAENSDIKFGFLLGAGLEIGISEAFAIQPELLFIQKGGKEEEGGVTAESTLNYLEIPVLAKFKFGSESVKAYVNAGPSIAYGIGGKIKTEGEILGTSFDSERDIKFGTEEGEDDLKPLDFGVQFGAGIGFAVGSGQLLIDLRYGLGLSNLEVVDVDDSWRRNRAIQISVGYAIPLGE